MKPWMAPAWESLSFRVLTEPPSAAMDIAADEGLRVSAYTAEPGTASADGLNLLASWAATLDQTGSASGQPGQAR